MYDLIIIGGGPAGTAAAVYAARKQLKTLLIVKEWGGQSIVSEDIQNWIGTPHISGNDLAKSLKAHVMEYKGDILEIAEGKFVEKVEVLMVILSSLLRMVRLTKVKRCSSQLAQHEEN